MLQRALEGNHDLLILDLGLPDGDGLSVLRELRRQMEPLPVLVLTARGGLQDRVNGLRSGAFFARSRGTVRTGTPSRVGRARSG